MQLFLILPLLALIQGSPDPLVPIYQKLSDNDLNASTIEVQLVEEGAEGCSEAPAADKNAIYGIGGQPAQWSSTNSADECQAACRQGDNCYIWTWVSEGFVGAVWRKKCIMKSKTEMTTATRLSPADWPNESGITSGIICPDDEDAVAELRKQLNGIKGSIVGEQNSASAAAGEACTTEVSVDVAGVEGDQCGLLGCTADSKCQRETVALQSEATAAANEIEGLEAQLAIDKQKLNALKKELRDAKDIHGTNADTVAEEAAETARHETRMSGLNRNIELLNKINSAFARENGAISMPSLLTTAERSDLSNLKLGKPLLLMLDQKLTANPELVRKIKALLERLINLLEQSIGHETTTHTATMEALQARTIDMSGEIAILEGDISDMNQKIADANKLLGEQKTLEALKTTDCGTRQETCIANHLTYTTDMTGFDAELVAVGELLDMLPQLEIDELDGQDFVPLLEGDVCKSGGVESGPGVDRVGDCPEGTACQPAKGQVAIGGEVDWTCSKIIGPRLYNYGIVPSDSAPSAHKLQEEFCRLQGSRLCTYEELCPAGCGDTTFQDDGHSWVPYSGSGGDYTNNGNSWVFLGTDGNHFPCRDHNGNRKDMPNQCSGLPDPWWPSGDAYGTGVYCCGDSE